MKKIPLLLLCFCALIITATAQQNTEKKHPMKIGITFSTLGNDKIPHLQKLITTHTGFEIDGFYAFGLNKYLEIETGVEYFKHSIISTLYVDASGRSVISPKKQSNIFHYLLFR
jgi:hypothetical protein